MKNYIHSSLIPRIAMLGTTKDYEVSSMLHDEMLGVFKGGYAHLLHEAMIPFYEKYIHFDTELFCHPHVSLRMVISNSMEDDPYFGQWFESIDLMELIESSWCEEKESRYNDIFHLMKCALSKEYDNDWVRLADEFRFRLLDEVECGTPWSREVCAIMNGICMIWKSSADESEKMRMLERMRYEWEFPYAHLFYAVFVERADEFIKRKTDRKKMEEHLKKIVDVMDTTPQSDDLDALCNLLFPEELNEYLAKHRPKDARQLRKEIAQLREELGETTRQMNQQVQAMADKMKALVEASVPIEEIEQELLLLDYNEAMGVFRQLNTLLLNNKAWVNNAGSIRNRIYQLKNVAKGGDTYNYASGAMHNDGRTTMNITPDDKTKYLE